MRSRLITLAAMAACAGAPGSATAQHAFRCDEPREGWQPQMALQKRLEQQGWRVRRVVTTNGCYEVYGFDAQRRRVEAFFNPRTFEPVGADAGH